MALILPFIFISYNASFKGKCKSILPICRITKIVHFMFCSSHMCMYFVPIRTVEILHKTNSAVFIS